MGEMVNRVRNDARAQASVQLRALPLNYLRRAKSATTASSPLKTLRVPFPDGRQSEEEALEAQRALIAFDPELKTDGVLRLNVRRHRQQVRRMTGDHT